MAARDTELFAILKIGCETSLRGTGLSLRDALARTHYRDLRAGFDPTDLLPLIRTHQTLTKEWIAYSEDKRTSGGWYLLEHGEIGRVFVPESRVCFDSLEEAVAEYVVRELDFWASLNEAN